VRDDNACSYVVLLRMRDPLGQVRMIVLSP